MIAKRLVWTAALASALLMAASPGRAANPGNMDLRVTLTGSLSVSIDGLSFTTRTLGGGPGAHLVPSSGTVVNDSLGLTEKWQLSVATVSGGGDWAVISSTGDGNCTNGGAGCPATDEYALQTLFISSHTSATCPGASDSKWDTLLSTVTGTGQTYTSARYADATAVQSATGNPDNVSGASDGNMFAASASGRGRRGMCVRLTMPAGSASPAEQVIRVTVTAVAGG